MLRWTLAAMTALCLAGSAPAQDTAVKSTPVTPAYLWQSGPVCAVPRFTDKPDWDAVASLGPLFLRGEPEAPGRQTDLRFARVGDVLHIRARCLDADPDALKKPDADAPLWDVDSLEFLFTQSPERKYPVLHLTVGAHGRMTLSRYLLPFGSWAMPLTEKPDPSRLKVTTSVDRTGWQAVIALPLGEYGFTGETFFVNVIRNRLADRSHHAWVDLCGGRTHRLDRMGRVTFVDAPVDATPRLKLPASLAVGTNPLQLDNWKAACKLLVNGQPLDVDAQGKTVLRIARHQLVDLDVVDPGGSTVAKYAAEVRRPLLVHCETPFGNDPTKPIPVRLTLNVVDKAAVTVQVVQDGKVVGEHRATLESGEHALAVAHKGAKPGEVEVVARAEVPSGDAPVTVSARHWCVVGMEPEAFDRFREGIGNLPTQSMLRAAVADAGPLLRLVQAGDGKIRGARGRGGYGFSEWSRGAAYLFALLYKADWPGNPHRGDVRYLRAAAAGIEEGLDPLRWQEMLDHPPNRGLQGYLLAFDLIRDDLAPDDREYFRKGLERLVETVITTWLDALRAKTSLYSEDIGTSTNHLAYYACDVYLAGRVLKRPEWVTLGAQMMRRLAAHEQDGQYPERRDVPAMHYTYLTMQNTALYHALSGDAQVRESLARSADFACHTSTPEGEVFGLFDGRNNHHGVPPHGDLALSTTSTGRAFARMRATQHVNAATRPSRSSPEYWFCTAVSAAHWPALDEAPLPDAWEFPFLRGRGLVAKRGDFTCGLSAVSVPPIEGLFRLDPQNAIALHHVEAGWILNGENSQEQPEAGSFLRTLGGRTEFLPRAGHVQRIDGGHAAVLQFDTFDVQVLCRVLSQRVCEVTVAATRREGETPVVFSFFPGVGYDGRTRAPEEIALSPDGRRITFRDVGIACSRAVQLERDFQIYNPYSGKRQVRVKPVRAYAELDVTQPLVLRIVVRDDKTPWPPAVTGVEEGIERKDPKLPARVLALTRYLEAVRVNLTLDERIEAADRATLLAAVDAASAKLDDWSRRSKQRPAEDTDADREALRTIVETLKDGLRDSLRKTASRP